MQTSQTGATIKLYIAMLVPHIGLYTLMTPLRATLVENIKIIAGIVLLNGFESCLLGLKIPVIS